LSEFPLLGEEQGEHQRRMLGRPEVQAAQRFTSLDDPDEPDQFPVQPDGTDHPLAQSQFGDGGDAIRLRALRR